MSEKSLLHDFILGDGRMRLLPHSRRAAFFFYGKEHFWKLLLCGVMTSVFFLPALFWMYSANFAKAQQLAALIPGQDGYLEAYSQILLQHAFSDSLALIPLTALFFVGLAGLFGICKRMILCQSSGCGEFFRAIRSNGLQSAACGAVFGISLFFLSFNYSYYQVSTLPEMVKGLLIGLSILQFVVVAMLEVYLMCGLAVYTNAAKQHILNGIKFTFGLFWKNLWVMGLCALPLILTVLIPSPWQLILLSLLPAFYVGFAALAVTCYCSAVFDQYINPTLGEEYVGIGLEKE